MAEADALTIEDMLDFCESKDGIADMSEHQRWALIPKARPAAPKKGGR